MSSEDINFISDFNSLIKKKTFDLFSVSKTTPGDGCFDDADAQIVGPRFVTHMNYKGSCVINIFSDNLHTYLFSTWKINGYRRRYWLLWNFSMLNF